MLKTCLCELLGLEVPIILAPMGTCTSGELAAAVSNEGGLGGIGSLFRPPRPSNATSIVVEALTNRPFAINHAPSVPRLRSLRRRRARPPIEPRPRRCRRAALRRRELRLCVIVVRHLSWYDGRCRPPHRRDLARPEARRALSGYYV